MSHPTTVNKSKKPLFDIDINEKLLTKQDVADFLNVSLKMIDRKVMLKEIPFLKIGRLVRFSKKSLIEWMNEGLTTR